MSAPKVDVLYDMRECAAILGSLRQEPAALRLLDAHDLLSELVSETKTLCGAVEFRIDDPRCALLDRVVRAIACVGGTS